MPASDLLLHEVSAMVMCLLFFGFYASVFVALIGHRAAYGRSRWLRALAEM